MKLTPKIVKEIIEDYTGLDISDLNREAPYSNARCIYSKICYDFLYRKFSGNAIGKVINRNRETIVSAANTSFPKKVKKDEFRLLYEEIKSRVEALTSADLYNKKSFNISLNRRIQDLENENTDLKNMYDRLKKSIYSPLIIEILDLTPEQMQVFRTRVNIILKSIKQTT